MELSKSITEFFEKNDNWRAEIDYLRNLLLSTELEESIKWGSPVYGFGSKNLIGIGAFKNYVGLWFFQGVFLEDHANKLINAQKDVTKALRQWRFTDISEMDASLILSYAEECIQNHKEGKELKPTKNKKVEIPEELSTALKKDANLQKAFDQLSPFKQKEFSEHIGSAKREATRISRLDKAIPMIMQGKGLNDKYR